MSRASDAQAMTVVRNICDSQHTKALEARHRLAQPFTAGKAVR
jgi:hypothetical protein